MITGQWWIGVFPGLALSLSVFGFALLVDGLREYLDPTRRHAFAGAPSAGSSVRPVDER